ncbi:MAG: hypothetical protein M1832_003349 [Thelocarpon impressellum]|nr:MAG: hypothetical protein M1832_003349 [Thelocarpon impressellum]
MGGDDIFRPDEKDSAPSSEVTERENKLLPASQKALPRKTLSNTNLPPRPGYGVRGTAIVLRTNYFHLLPDPKQTLYRYQVAIEPEEKVVRKRRRILALLIQDAPFATPLGAVATDYASTLVSSIKLDLGPDERTVASIVYRDEGESEPRPGAKVYTIKVQYSRAMPLSELLSYVSSADTGLPDDGKEELVQALNIVMSKTPNTTPGTVVVARNKHFPAGPSAVAFDLRGGLIALRGYFASVRTATLRVLININVCTAAFYRPGPLLNLMRDFREQCKGPLIPALEAFLRRVRVETTYLKDKKGLPAKKIKTISGLARPPHAPRGADSIQATFQCDELGGRINVKDFFAKRHGITLEKPNAPVINVGLPDKPVFVPPELCTVLPGQVARRKLTDVQTAEMIKVACRRPAENARLIAGEGSQVVGISGGTPTTFGVRVRPTMLTVPGRILSAPGVVYLNGSIRPEAGSWNMIKKKFSVGAAIRDWSYLRIGYGGSDPLQGSLQALVNTFKRTMDDCGLRADAPKPSTGYAVTISNDDDASRAALKEILGKIQRSTVKMLLVVLPDQRASTYASVKYLADVVYGIHNVCVVAQKLAKEKGQLQYMANVALKFNLKRGGTNQTLPADQLGVLRDGRTMVVGIDVTHPSPGSQKGAPSIAGLVASVDARFGQWPASIRIQEGRKEMVTELKAMLVERLRLWQKKNNAALPSRILVYRDGVSEGQYETVLREELPPLREACQQVYPAKGAKPQISIVIVGKRHHTRFFPVKAEDADRTGNPKNGTVVDRGITSHAQWDFFLQAHTGLQGTVRPAHYVVVHDEIGLGADGLQELTHGLCYLFGRATKAVSICPPAYYADLLCERGRCYLHSVLNADSAASASGGSEAGFDASRADWVSGVHAALAESMFYI